MVPRAVVTALRISRYAARALWYAWPRAATALYKEDGVRREDFLGAYAPFYLLVLLVVWVVALTIGWGLVFYGLRAELRPAGMTFEDAVYFAGASLLTIGYGDITPHGALARVFALACGASGLGSVAIVISFLFSIFGAFQTRERFVVTISARAGLPPSGVGLLEMHAYAALRESLANVFRDGQAWTAGVMETHLAYPVLMYFRSNHDYQSWVGTLGTLLDAAALLITTIEPSDTRNAQNIGEAGVMYELGRHLTNDLTHTFFFVRGAQTHTPGIEEYEFRQAVERLRPAGYRTRDVELAWRAFGELRRRYGPQLNALARWLEIPPVQWVGDRSLLHSGTH